MSQFHKLKVKDIRYLTDDSVEITFDIPSKIKENFIYQAGQYITIRKQFDEDDVRRAYSLCSDPNSDKLSIGVKKVEGGVMSTYLTTELKQGDDLLVMEPNGNFILKGNNVVGICAGSGITPILSMIKSTSTNFALVYGNQSPSTTMFLDEIMEMDIDLHLAYSKQIVDGCYNGRIDSNFLEILSNDESFLLADHYFICGPGDMISNTESFLLSNGVDKSQIHFEKFTSDNSNQSHDIALENQTMSDVTVIIDGDEFSYELPYNGDTILDSALDSGADLPYSCKGAVCCTCKAKVMEGEATMDQNFSLSDVEVEDGYILACQAHPSSKNIIVDFDEI